MSKDSTTVWALREIDRLREALRELCDAVAKEVDGGHSGSGFLLARLSDARKALVAPASKSRRKP